MPLKTRVKRPVYAPVLKLPPLPYEQFIALRDNIAVNGVLVPIVVDSDGPRRAIIDGNYRKAIADELGYDCPEIVQADLSDEEKRTLARALNVARRQLTQEQKRQLVADQLHEMPEKSNRWIGKQLGVHHATVAAVRTEMEGTGQIIQLERTVGEDGKERPAIRQPQVVHRPPAERQARIKASTLIQGDCRKELRKIAGQSIDAIITDPIYPEVDREYGKITEADWHDLMRTVVGEAKRILKPSGSMVVIIQPNSEKVGKTRLWLWDFVAWAGREFNLVQDAYWWAVDAMPLGGIKQGLMRPSVKMCVWLGPPNCYRNQEKVLMTPSERTSARHRSDVFLRTGPSGKTYRNSTIAKAADERGGTTPFNCLPIPAGGSARPGNQHPAVTPYELAAWWCRYTLPPNGVLLDCFAGSGNVLLAGLDHGASQVIGIDKEKKYINLARQRIAEG